MKKSSIHFRPVLSTSEAHNTRKIIPHYVLPNVKDKNVSKIFKSIAEVRKIVEHRYMTTTGQKMQAKSTPIKEAVINLDAPSFLDNESGKYTIEACVRKLATVAAKLKDIYDIECFQFHLHLDEGKPNSANPEIPPPFFERNLHAHLIFNWTDITGRSIKLNRKDMSDIQTIVAEVLGLERGAVWSKAERLEHGEFRAEKERMEKELQQLGEELRLKKAKLAGLINESKS